MFSHAKCAWPSFRLSLPPTPEKSLCFLMQNALGLHFDCKFTCHSRRPRRNRCVFSCKMRLAFISTVNLHVTPANPGEIVVFLMKNARCTNLLDFLVFLSGNMRLAFLVTVNSYDPRPTAPGFRIFFQLKRASRKPFQIPCVFSSKTRLAFNVIVNLYDSGRPLPHSLSLS